MDEDNISDLNSRSPKGSSAKILLLGDFDPEGDKIIRDPYYVMSKLKVNFNTILKLNSL